jgi:hypothetical protein
VYVTGSTQSPNFPVVNPLINPLSTPPNMPMNGLSGSEDAFVAKVTPGGNALAFSTYLGGTNTAQGTAIAVHTNSVSGGVDMYVAGDTNSSDFPVYSQNMSSLLQPTCGQTGGACDNGDGFVAVIPGTSTPQAALSSASVSFGPQTINTTSASQTVTFTNSGDTAITIMNITVSGNFAATYDCGYILSAGKSCTITITFTPTAVGNCTGVLTVTDNSGNSPHTATLSGSGTALSSSGGTAGSGSTSGTADFTLSGASTLTASPGNSANLTLSLTPANGFSETVTLACTVPQPATCNVTPASVLVSGTTAASATATVTVPSASGSSSNPVSKGASLHRTGPWRTLLPFSVFGFALIGRRRRLWLPLLLVVLCLALTLAGCGGGSAGSASTSAMAAGSYNMSVTATYTGGTSPITHVLNVTLQVTQ